MDPVEEIILRAQERGDFDNLPGAGKPIAWREKPFVPPEWRLAYDMLANSGFAPDLVEEEKSIRMLFERIEAERRQFALQWATWSSRLPWSERDSVRRREARASFLRSYEEQLRAANARVHHFNMSAPTAMQRGTMLLERAMANAARSLPFPA